MTSHSVNNVANKISLGKPKDGKAGMKFANVYNNEDNAPIYLKICESVVVFEPSVYNGTGDETRKGIVLEISEDDAKLIEDVERSVRAMVASDKWNSCIRRENKSVRVKAKIEMSGERSCEFHGGPDEGDGAAPSSLRGRKASVILHVKGLYVQRNASGLMIDVVAMRYGEKPSQTSFKSMLLSK